MNSSRLVVFVSFLLLTACDDKKQATAQAHHAVDENAAQATAVATRAAADRQTAKAALQTDVDAVDRKLTYLRERALKGASASKAEVQKALSEVDTKRDAVRVDMNKMDSATGADWDAVKASATADLQSLHTAVDDLEPKITGKAAH